MLKRWLKSDDKQSSSATAPAVAEAPRAGIEGDVAALRHDIAHANLNSSSALDLLAVRMKDRTRATGAAIALRDGDAVICRASVGNAPPAGTPLNIDNTVTGECYRSGNIVSITDTQKDSRVDAKLCRQLEFRSLLIVPIADEEEVVGVLEVFSPLAGNFEGGDVLLLGSIAEVAAEIYGAQQRKPGARPPVAAQPIPFLVSERVEQMLQRDETQTETKEESKTPADNATQNSIAPATNEGIDTRASACRETEETAPSAFSHSSEDSGKEQNEETENRWKARNYLLLMAGLTVLGIGMGDIADWHMMSRLTRSSAQHAAATSGRDLPAFVASDPKLPDHDNGSLNPANDMARLRIAAPPPSLGQPVGAKLEKSSLTRKSATDSNAIHSLASHSQPPALVSPSDAVPLAGPVPNLDPKTTSQLIPAKLIHRVDPVVPDFAKNAGVEGTVLLSAVIGTDGKLKDVKFVSGDRALAVEAFHALREWRYRPYMLNGKPIAAETRIVMNFRR